MKKLFTFAVMLSSLLSVNAFAFNSPKGCPGVWDITNTVCSEKQCVLKDGEVFERHYVINLKKLGDGIGYPELYRPIVDGKITNFTNVLSLMKLRVKDESEACAVFELGGKGSGFYWPSCVGPYAKWKIAVAPAIYNRSGKLEAPLIDAHDSAGQYEPTLEARPMTNYFDRSIAGPYLENDKSGKAQCEFYEVSEGPIEADKKPLADEDGNTKASDGELFSEKFTDTYTSLAQGGSYPLYYPIGEQFVTYTDSIVWDYDDFCFSGVCHEDLQILIFESDDAGFADDVLAFFVLKKSDPKTWVVDNEFMKAEFAVQFPDKDMDTIVDEKDNCPNHPNVDQADWDKDGKGAPCDTDDNGLGAYLDGIFKDVIACQKRSASKTKCVSDANVKLQSAAEKYRAPLPLGSWVKTFNK